MKGVDTRPLRLAAGKYAAWLKAERSALRRKRSLSHASDPFPITRILTEKLLGICGEIGGFQKLCGNARLGKLITRLVLEDCVFDYSTLSPTLPPVLS